MSRAGSRNNLSDLEIDAIASGIFKHLLEHTEHPLDGIAVLGTVMLKIFDNAAQNLTIEEFGSNVRDSLIESYHAQSAQGTGTVQ